MQKAHPLSDNDVCVVLDRAELWGLEFGVCTTMTQVSMNNSLEMKLSPSTWSPEVFVDAHRYVCVQWLVSREKSEGIWVNAWRKQLCGDTVLQSPSTGHYSLDTQSGKAQISLRWVQRKGNSKHNVLQLKQQQIGLGSPETHKYL